MEFLKVLPIIAPLFIIQLILIIVALIDLLKRTQTFCPKWVWVIIILFGNIIGPIIYFIIGRREH